MEFQSSKNKEITLNRRHKIVELLENSSQVKVNELSQLFEVSEVTIRSDLSFLENKNLLIRARGGAIKPQGVAMDYRITEKALQHHKEKVAIGKAAIELINEGDTIILDSGTTTMEIAKNLFKFNKLTVITNALNIATLLTDIDNIKVVIPGGILRKNSFSLVGPSAEFSFRNFFCDKVFLGTNGIDLEYGISTVDMEESYLNKIMIDISKEVIVVADSSKFSQKTFARISSIDKVHTIVTDKKISDEDYQNLEKKNIKIILA
jgi:DeoR family transcriptional regulator, aga operon transcriptional repressor